MNGDGQAFLYFKDSHGEWILHTPYNYLHNAVRSFHESVRCMGDIAWKVYGLDQRAVMAIYIPKETT